MELHVFGASGSGTTTLGGALAGALGCPYFDTDSYYWLPGPPEFTVRRPPAERNAQLAADLARHPDAVVGGAVGNWGDEWFGRFDAAVFLWLPPALRLTRLAAREQQRYGPAFEADPAQAQRTADFLAWAAGYDDGRNGGTRTLATHTAWLTRFACPVLTLRGDLTVAARVAAVRAWLPTL